MRAWGRALLVAVVTAVAVLAGSGAHAEDDGPGAGPDALRVDRVAQAMRSEQVVTAPGAIAVFDPDVVLPALARDVRLVLGPPDPRLDSRFYDEVVVPLRAAAEEQEVAVVLVTGLDVRLVEGRDGGAGGAGTTASGLDGLQVLLGSYDITDLVVLAASLAADPDAGGTPDPVPDTPPATAEQAAPVLAGLQADRYWAAPGTDPGLAGAQRWDDLLTGVGLRIATLPAAERGAPQPDLLPALTAAFPGEVVVVVRGRWVDVGGPDQELLTSARNWALGRYSAFFTERGTPVDALVREVLERAEELRTGDPFARDPLAPTTVERLAQRWVPPTAIAVSLALLAASGTVAARRSATRSRVDATAERATALAELASLDAELLVLLDAPTGRRGQYALATAAERRDTARALYEGSDDAGTATAVREAVTASRTALAQVRT